MTVIRGQLFFAPGIQMRDLDLENPRALLDAFERRVEGLFLAPIRVLAECSHTEEGALFASALLVAALIESLARVDTQTKAEHAIIKNWLESRLAAFNETVMIDGASFSLAAVFEDRFRNGLAHHGYVAGLARLSREIAGSVVNDGPIVTINPFALAEAVAEQFKIFADELRNGRRDIHAFQHLVRKQFHREIERARQEAA
jgi:hypothetical protein